jgi:hypothetical protein
MRIQLEPSDYLAATVLHTPRTLIIIPALGLFFVCLGAFDFAMYFRTGDQSGITGLLIGGFLLATSCYARYVALPRRTRRLFRQQKALQRPYEMVWDADEIRRTSETGNTRIPWSDILKWREGNRMFLLYLSDVTFYIIPKRAFANETAIDEFRKLLRDKILT